MDGGFAPAGARDNTSNTTPLSVIDAINLFIRVQKDCLKEIASLNNEMKKEEQEIASSQEIIEQLQTLSTSHEKKIAGCRERLQEIEKKRTSIEAKIEKCANIIDTLSSEKNDSPHVLALLRRAERHEVSENEEHDRVNIEIDEILNYRS